MKPEKQTPPEENDANDLASRGCLESSCCASLARDSAKAIDEIIRDAINATIGGDWVIADLRGRLQRITIQGQAPETYYLDGKPILELWPVELETVNDGKSFVVHATRQYRTFQHNSIY
jgi:hypothetical protein